MKKEQSSRLYMVVETFKEKGAAAVYRRFREKGRMAPAGLSYVSSWVDEEMTRCYQLMETHDPSLLDIWISCWNDLIDFEIILLISSKEAAERVDFRL